MFDLANGTTILFLQNTGTYTFYTLDNIYVPVKISQIVLNTAVSEAQQIINQTTLFSPDHTLLGMLFDQNQSNVTVKGIAIFDLEDLSQISVKSTIIPQNQTDCNSSFALEFAIGNSSEFIYLLLQCQVIAEGGAPYLTNISLYNWNLTENSTNSQLVYAAEFQSATVQ